MKIKLKQLITIAFSFWAIFQLHSQGYIVENGVTYGGYEPGLGYRINVLHDPTGLVPLNSTNTQFWLNPVGKTQPTTFTNTFSFSELVDIGVDVFLVSSNDPVSLQPVLLGSYTQLSIYSSTNYVFQSGAPFYVGLYSGASFAAPPNATDPNLYNNPVFGWALLINNRGVIQMLNSALEYEGGGIYAGTQTIIPVPEPSALALGTLGALLFSFRCFANRK